MNNHCQKTKLIKRTDMDKLQQVKAKLEEMKAKYVLEHEEEDTI